MMKCEQGIRVSKGHVITGSRGESRGGRGAWEDGRGGIRNAARRSGGGGTMEGEKEVRKRTGRQ